MASKDYSIEFKLQAISKVIFQNYSISAAAEVCKVSNFKMYTWVKKYETLLKEKHKQAQFRMKAEHSIQNNKAESVNAKERNSERTHTEQTFVN